MGSGGDVYTVGGLVRYWGGNLGRGTQIRQTKSKGTQIGYFESKFFGGYANRVKNQNGDKFGTQIW